MAMETTGLDCFERSGGGVINRFVISSFPRFPPTSRIPNTTHRLFHRAIPLETEDWSKKNRLSLDRILKGYYSLLNSLLTFIKQEVGYLCVEDCNYTEEDCNYIHTEGG
jgi:hypothetical protein